MPLGVPSRLLMVLKAFHWCSPKEHRSSRITLNWLVLFFISHQSSFSNPMYEKEDTAQRHLEIQCFLETTISVNTVERAIQKVDLLWTMLFRSQEVVLKAGQTFRPVVCLVIKKKATKRHLRPLWN